MRDHVSLSLDSRSSITATFNVSLIWDTDLGTVTLRIFNLKNFGLSDLKIRGLVSITPTKLPTRGIKNTLLAGGSIFTEAPRANAPDALGSVASPVEPYEVHWNVGNACSIAYTLVLNLQHDPLIRRGPGDEIIVRVFAIYPVFHTGRASSSGGVI